MSMTIIDKLQNQLGKEKVLTGASLNDRYTHIWRMHQPLVAKALLIPDTTEEVATIMRICHAHQQPVVLHGGLTNLVGSTTTQKNEIAISLERLNKIEEVDTGSRTLTAQAGVILSHIHQSADAQDLLFPLNFGAKGSAQIGGIVSTNAGGLRVFKYGMARNLVLGLEVVLADGTIISSLKKIIKDNSAYDIKQLFVGSEGTLGIITKVVLRLVEKPRSRTSAFVGINGYDKVVNFLKFMDAGLAGNLSAFELIWKNSYSAMTASKATPPPLPYHYQYYVLIESLGNHQIQDQQQVENLLTQALEEQIILDAVPASSAADQQWFWKIREDVHALKILAKNDHHFDISLPTPQIGQVVEKITKALESLAEVEVVFPFGHVADGNIHFIIGKKNASAALTHQINKIVYAPLQDLGGSVSAEHGIGLDKKPYLHLCRTSAEINLMKTLKQALDPFGILNRGKIFDHEVNYTDQ